MHMYECVGFLRGNENRRGDRVGVKLLGQKLIWSEIRNRGRGTKDVSRHPHFKKGSQAYVSDHFAWHRTFCQKCFGYFSQHKKKSVNKTSKNMKTDTLNLHKLGHLAIPKLATCEVLQSPEK